MIVGDHESIYSLSLPEISDSKWKAPETARTSLPTFRDNVQASRDTWQILAILGGLGLLIGMADVWALRPRFSARQKSAFDGPLP